MTLGVGVIGVGMIGQDHIRRLTHVLSGARVAAVTDVDLDRARTVADDLPRAALHATGQDLIADPDVDAVVVTSWGPTHEEYVLACIEAGKQVFCEKPLATTAGGLRPDRRRRGRGGSADGHGRLHAALRRAVPGHEAGGDQRRDRAAAADARRAPQPVGAVALHQRHDHQRQHRARHRRRPVDVRRRDRRHHRAQAAGEQQGRGRLQRPAARAAGDGERRARGRRGHGERGLRLRHPRRGGLRGRHRRAVGERGRPGQERRTGQRPRAGPLAGALRPRVRHRVPGLDRRRHGRRHHRPQRVGRLRGHGRVRDGPGRAALRRARSRWCCVSARTSTRSPLREARGRPLHAAEDAAAGAAGAGRGARLPAHRAVPARGLPAVLRAPAGRPGDDRGVPQGARRRRRGDRLGAAALQVVGPRRGRAAGRGALLAPGHPDHRRPRLRRR